MPFKIFHRQKKEKHTRDRSKSCLDLSGEPPDLSKPALFNENAPGLEKSKRKGSLPPFHIPKFGHHHGNKNDSHVNFKKVKKDKAFHEFLKNRSKSISQLNESNEEKEPAEPMTIKEEEKVEPSAESVSESSSTSLSPPPVVHSSKIDSQAAPPDSEHRHYIPHGGGDFRNHNHNHNHHHHRHYHNDNHRARGPKKSASCGSHMEGLGRDNRDRRMSDIEQLDNYIEYLRRNTTDDGNMANRLCCAQVLRISFLRLQQMHVNDALHSSSHDSLGYGSGHGSPPLGHHNGVTHHRKHLHWKKPGSHPELDSFSLDEGEAGDLPMVMDDSDSSDGHINVVCSPDQDSEAKTPSERDSFSAHDSDDSDTPEMWSKSLRTKQRKSVPVFPMDIEIF